MYLPAYVSSATSNVGAVLAGGGAIAEGSDPVDVRDVRGVAEVGDGSAAKGQQPAATAPPPDDDLVSRVPAHDAAARAALETLYRRYSASVYGLALRIVGDSGLAENLVQETFCRLWVHAAQYESGRVRFATWLLRMARNLAISELRYAARRPRLISFGATVLRGSDGEVFTLPAMDEQRDPAVDVPDEVWARERRRLIAAGLEGLPPLQRHALELAYYGGLSHAEIAAVQGAPMSTVKTRLALGLRKMADHLSACGVTA